MLIFTLTSCERQDIIDELQENTRVRLPNAIATCKSHGLTYISHYTNNLEEWTVVCIQPSPLQIKEYLIS